MLFSLVHVFFFTFEIRFPRTMFSVSISCGLFEFPSLFLADDQFPFPVTSHRCETSTNFVPFRVFQIR